VDRELSGRGIKRIGWHKVKERFRWGSSHWVRGVMVAVVAFNKPVPEILTVMERPRFRRCQDAITIAAVESIGQRRC